MDITILYITMNLMPQKWVDFQNQHLLKAADGAKIISISRQPIILGTNHLDTGTPGYWNLYLQILRAAKLATTPFVALADGADQYNPITLYYRTAATPTALASASWTAYTVPFTSLGYIQLKAEA